MKLSLIHFEATDRLTLSGLLYEPPKRTRRVAIFLHGNGGGSIFSSPRTNIFGEQLIRFGLAFFPFDNRGAHLIKTLKRRKRGSIRRVDTGMTYELIRDCVHDIDGAVTMLRSMGYRKFFLIGHSTGANKIALYHYRRRRHPIARSILLGGCDDLGLYYDHMGGRGYHHVLKKCREMVRRGKGKDLVPKGIAPFWISYQALRDTLDPNGDYNVFPFLDRMKDLGLAKKKLFREVRSMRRPVLAVYGDEDEYCFGDVKRCVEIFKEEVRDRENIEFAIMKGSDHSFHDREKALARLMGRWLTGP